MNVFLNEGRSKLTAILGTWILFGAQAWNEWASVDGFGSRRRQREKEEEHEEDEHENEKKLSDCWAADVELSQGVVIAVHPKKADKTRASCSSTPASFSSSSSFSSSPPSSLSCDDVPNVPARDRSLLTWRPTPTTTTNHRHYHCDQHSSSNHPTLGCSGALENEETKEEHNKKRKKKKMERVAGADWHSHKTKRRTQRERGPNQALARVVKVV